MWKEILIVASTVLGLGVIGFSFRYRRTGLDYNSVLWRFVAAAAGLGAACFAVASTVDNDTWWLLPGVLFFVVFFLATGGIARTAKSEFEKLRAQEVELTSSLHSLLSLREPKVVDYSRFVLRYGWTMDHVRKDGSLCEVFVGPGTPRLSEFIEAADEHECVSSDAPVLMRRVA